MKEKQFPAMRAAQRPIVPADAHQTLSDFFTRYPLPEAQQQLDELARSATVRHQHRQRRKPYRMMRFAKRLHHLLHSVHDLFTNEPEMHRQQPANAAPRAHQCNAFPHERFAKEPRLIEQVANNPIGIIQEVFDWLFIEDFRDDLLPKWLRLALANEGGAYTEADQRGQLMVFYDHLLPLLEALLLISESDQEEKNNDTVEHDETTRQIKLLTPHQMEHPQQVITAFCNRFDRDYVRRELWDFLEAGIKTRGSYPEGFSASWALTCYDYVSCLTEAAYKLA